MKKWMALLLCMLMVCAMLPHGALAQAEQEEPEKATTFNFRNGITWDSTVEEIIAIENMQHILAGGEELYWLEYESVAVSRYSDAYLQYAFLENKLMCAVYAINDTSKKDLDYLTKALSSKYGEPAEMDDQKEWERIEPYVDDDMLYLMLDKEEFNDWSCWTLEDGTYLNIFRRFYGSYNQDEEIIILYLNEPALLKLIPPYDTTGL